MNHKTQSLRGILLAITLAAGTAQLAFAVQYCYEVNFEGTLSYNFSDSVIGEIANGPKEGDKFYGRTLYQFSTPDLFENVAGSGPDQYSANYFGNTQFDFQFGGNHLFDYGTTNAIHVSGLQNTVVFGSSEQDAAILGLPIVESISQSNSNGGYEFGTPGSLLEFVLNGYRPVGSIRLEGALDFLASNPSSLEVASFEFFTTGQSSMGGAYDVTFDSIHVSKTTKVPDNGSSMFVASLSIFALIATKRFTKKTRDI
ncbi:hypothetical protein [Pelagicoccus sp. SDUM812002]|uniref:hypothetical protein n=1 Tax=Pelagicoccus sp. SDUM812002 TaxID=3041266 RepID=UPI00280EA194|nr:hypothetical protein [Pelagicoccus sp. SDUM812002]MDQ8186259.1 hypothetical protein [Pelagicoccus sp. SDUM812002]